MASQTPTHFLAFPIQDEEIRDRRTEFQEYLVARNFRLQGASEV